MRNAITPAVELVPNEASVMVGGFMGADSPHRVINALAHGAKPDADRQ